MVLRRYSFNSSFPFQQIASKSSNVLFPVVGASSSSLSLSLLSSILLQSPRLVHERLHKGRERFTSDENLEAAKSALLQLNVMISQNIEPDAIMYTSLITVMGKSGLEWQAFKLFSRMLEQGVKPLPETYLALKRATNPKRTKMIAQIEEKMNEANSLLPQQLANALKDKREMSERVADRNMRMMKNPSQYSSSSQEQEQGEENEREEDENESGNKNNKNNKNKNINMKQEKSKKRIAELWNEGNDIPVMKIDSVESVMATIKELDARREQQASIATGQQRNSLLKRLQKLHEEELKILLTIHRQARNGNRNQLLQRVLSQVPAKYVETMLDRRDHFFDSVRQVLDLQIDELKASEEYRQDHLDFVGKISSSSNNNEKNEEDDESSLLKLDPKKRQELLKKLEDGKKEGEKSILEAESLKNQLGNHHFQQNENEIEQVSTSSTDLSHIISKNSQKQQQQQQQQRVSPTDASELTAHEKYTLAPPYLESPWGLLRKPPRAPGNVSQRNPERDEIQKLLPEEMTMLENAIISPKQNYNNNNNNNNNGGGGGLDQVPPQLLRRYCRQFHLKWNRAAGIVALQELVEWHLRNIVKEKSLSSSSNNHPHHQQNLLQQQQEHDDAELEKKAQQQTLDQYNTLMAVARVTDNMRLVDDADVSRNVIIQRAKERVLRKETLHQQELNRHRQKLQHLNESMKKMPTAKSSHINENSQQQQQELLQKQLDEKMFGDNTLSSTKKNSTVLGISSSENEQQQQQQQPPQNNKYYHSDETIQELPPWEVMSSASPLNLRTGRFVGEADAEYYEDSTGKYRVRRPHASKQKERYVVDESLLPAPQQSRLREERLRGETGLPFSNETTENNNNNKKKDNWDAAGEDTTNNDEEDDEKSEKRHFQRYSRFERFVKKAKQREQLRRDASGATQPLNRVPLRPSMKFTKSAKPPTLKKNDE